MEVWFLRHGEPVDKDAWKGDDRSRPLSPQGEERMEREAAVLASWKPGLEWILSSPLLRAEQTARVVARALRLENALACDERLAPGFGKSELLPIVGENRERKAILLVGHAPDLGRLVAACIGGGRVEMKAGSLARVELQDVETLSGTLLLLMPQSLIVP